MTIHPTAIVDKKAELDSSVIVGPYAVIGEGVRIDAGTEVAPHAVLSGPTTIGKDNEIGSFTTIGGAPQDLKYAGEPTELIIGDKNRIREYASLHRGTVQGGGKTVIGSGNLLMSYIHIAHDCILGDNIIMSNVATMAGHVEVGDCATIGGLVAVHQFCRVGKYSYIGGVSGMNQDIPPYMLITGTRNRTRVSGVNKVGLRRKGFSRELINKIDQAYRIIFRTEGLLLKEALENTRKEISDCPEVEELVKFFEDSQRGVVRRISED